MAPKQSFSIASVAEDLGEKGFENMGAKDLALPFLKVLGQLSPQVTQGDPEFIADARPGMIFNSVTKDLFDGLQKIQCACILGIDTISLLVFLSFHL